MPPKILENQYYPMYLTSPITVFLSFSILQEGIIKVKNCLDGTRFTAFYTTWKVFHSNDVCWVRLDPLYRTFIFSERPELEQTCPCLKYTNQEP